MQSVKKPQNRSKAVHSMRTEFIQFKLRAFTLGGVSIKRQGSCEVRSFYITNLYPLAGPPA